MTNQITAFVSYSWDSEVHTKWVLDFVNALRRNGIDAKMDIMHTQNSTINLNQMMITNLRDNDYIIIVLTENYAKRANDFQGGVGFETTLSLPILQENPDKIIFVTRHKGNFQDAFPFHLKGYYAINFSNDQKFDDSLSELLHRILKVPLYEIEPLGDTPDLKPKNTGQVARTTSANFSDFKIPNLQQATDKNIDDFMNQSYQDISKLLSDLLKQVSSENSNLEFNQKKIDNTKSLFDIYLNGEHKTSIKIWLGGIFGRDSIQLSYGSRVDIYNDNSCNESISHKIDSNNNLTLKMMMNISGNKNANTPEQIVEEIWQNQILHHLK